MVVGRVYTTACIAKLNFKQREFVRGEISPKLLHIEFGDREELDLIETPDPPEGAMVSTGGQV